MQDFLRYNCFMKALLMTCGLLTCGMLHPNRVLPSQVLIFGATFKGFGIERLAGREIPVFS